MQYWQTAIRLSEVAQLADIVIYNYFVLIYYLVRLGFPIYNHIRSHHIVISKARSQYSIFLDKVCKIVQMSILGKTTCLYRVAVAKAYNMPLAWAKILQMRKCCLKELHVNLLKLCSRCLPL